MGAYLDRLNAQYDEIRDGIDALVNRAADDGRDVTDAEQTQVDRDRQRLSELQTAIGHYSELDQQTARVAELRRSAPAPAARTTAQVQVNEPYDVTREFPTVGDYAITVHRAFALKDPEAIAKLDRATAHQLLADNPGIIPKPVLGPVINMVDSSRPFINSITRKALPAGSFERPQITQHVAVGKQVAEKTLTESQKMVIGKMPVTAATYAGHLNISRQDIKWTSPGILSIVFDDFAAVYASVTDNDAADQFVTSVASAPITIDDDSPTAITKALYGAAATSMNAALYPPDTLWVSPEVWGVLGGSHTEQGNPGFPSLSLTSTGGNPLGLKLVVDPHFPAGTMIMGPSRLCEWYEDVDGLMQVGEPDVLGQLVGYAGFGAFLNVAPAAYSKFTAPVPAP
jgi:HK97 family phage major capsid protein